MGQLRRSMLYVPGNNPGMIRDAGIYGADCVLFDLEDSVSIYEKDAARCLVCEALTALDYSGTEIFVRINDPAERLGRLDLEAVVPLGKAVIRLPKVETAETVRNCDAYIARIERAAGITPRSTKIMAAVESAQGVLNAAAIASASPRMLALAIGAEDYTADLKTARSKEGAELLFGRNMVVHAARSAGIDAIDTVFSDINDEAGFAGEVAAIRQLGFDGKSVINPRQIKPLHSLLAPTDRELEDALMVMDAYEEARQRGSGVASLGGKMIDRPVVLRAQRIIGRAGKERLLKKGKSYG